MFNDSFIQSKVKEDLKRFKENTLKGCIWINGNFQTLVPDVLALAEHSFGLDIKGGLNKHEVYSNYWIKKDKSEIDVIRYPHIANEHNLLKVVTPKKFDWYQYSTEGIVTSIYDSLALKANSADYTCSRDLKSLSSIFYSKSLFIF
ncbi:hypothetical protein F502_04942 [Clostridium pasteurianum DSM 525 = ATCC 6013]|uniref:hypothetical protein n=1 Tax=Clostridium pasteurianum TaxID=1501 RepID=UPI0002A75A47|nr:hypothetical protein [Clostridium pasteurianum]ELP59954.1 hypothetical protein F502_04942 [Clostridium pasteurianum DSM 525 = ATCC 6013]